MSRIANLTVLLLIAASQTGCMRAITQAYYELRGAKAEIHLSEDFVSGSLDRYRGVAFEPVKTALTDRIVTPRVLTYYDEGAREVKKSLADVYPGGQPALRITSEVLYFQKKGILSDSMCLTRVRLFDGERSILDGVVLAESRAYREGSGEEALAKASVEAVGKLLRTRANPEEPAEEDEEDSGGESKDKSKSDK